MKNLNEDLFLQLQFFYRTFQSISNLLKKERFDTTLFRKNQLKNYEYFNIRRTKANYRLFLTIALPNHTYYSTQKQEFLTSVKLQSVGLSQIEEFY